MPIIVAPPAEVSLISELESTLGITLPQKYKEFLGKHNGLFVSHPDYIDINFQDVDSEIISFSSFFGINASNKNFDLASQNENLRSEIDFLNETVVVGDDPGGNYFLLEVQGGREAVYYWDRARLHEGDEKKTAKIAGSEHHGACYLVAPDFSSFYESVRNSSSSSMTIEVKHWPG